MTVTDAEALEAIEMVGWLRGAEWPDRWCDQVQSVIRRLLEEREEMGMEIRQMGEYCDD